MARQIWIPHGKKMAVKDLPPGSDPSDPPLTPEAKIAAAQLKDHLVHHFRKPGLIFRSPKLRCQETAQPAVDEFGQHHLGGVVVIELNCLAQSDSGDVDPTNPKAKPDGLVIYGPESVDADWRIWFLTSRCIIRAVVKELRPQGPVWVYTHRPFLAAGRYATTFTDNFIPGKGDLKTLDPSLLPYCVFEDGTDGSWKEVPRPS